MKHGIEPGRTPKNSDTSGEGRKNTFAKERIYQKEWTVADPKAAIVLLHGQGEHIGRYEYVAASFNARGYDVYSGDLPGHGQSGGIKGHIDRFDDYVALAASWIEDVHRRSPELPLFLLGHSVGGLIAARYIQTREPMPSRASYGSPDGLPDGLADGLADGLSDRLPDMDTASIQTGEPKLAGVVLSSPAFQLRYPIPPWKEAIGLRLDRLLPSLRMPSGLKQQRVTRNEEIQLSTTADPLMVYVASVRFYNELLRAQASALADADRIQLPLLLLHGGADEIIVPEQSLEFGRRVTSLDKDVRLLPELHHEIMNEPERDEVLRDIADWLDSRAALEQQ